MRMLQALVMVLSIFATPTPQALAAADLGVNIVAERYVRLVLAVGEHESGYVDAYYGPEEWRAAVKESRPSLKDLKAEADVLLSALGQQSPDTTDALAAQRIQFLSRQLTAVQTRLRMLVGEKFTFDEETRLLFDATVPRIEVAELEAARAQLDALIEGEGSLQERFVQLREEFTIPKDRLPNVFSAAIAACRDRTSAFLTLPDNEHFTTEYVTNKPWSGYNWYQGGAMSLIQVNTDLPSTIDSAVNLGCHEGYPGHHVFNTLLETSLVDGHGWVEFSVYPLYSPQSLLAEGTASFARMMAFPGRSQTEFEAKVLYPLAGLDAARAQYYSDALAALGGLRYARIEGARRYLDGEIDRAALVDWLARYQLISKERAEQGVDFIETYRGYVINYTLGSDLSAAYVNRLGGTNPAARWQAYITLMSTPLTASMLEQ